jgi:hypothetical protein
MQPLRATRLGATMFWIVAAAAVVTAPSAAAQGEAERFSRPVDRRFTFVEESLHGATPGHFELEQWVSWNHGARIDPGLDRFEFKHEIEYGISDGLHFAVDLAEWDTSDSGGETHTRYRATAAELKFRLADPRADAIGVGFKTELGLGPGELEWENVLILDKIVDRWEVAYNLIATAGFEGDKTFSYHEGELAVTQTAGLSYEMNPTLYWGCEIVHEIPPEWTWGERQSWFAGVTVAVRGDEWALTTTPMFLLDGIADAPRFQLRLLFEVDF